LAEADYLVEPGELARLVIAIARDRVDAARLEEALLLRFIPT
jgi:hypothetical protein